MPALLMTTSTLPNASTAACTIAAPPSGVATELVSATASPPAALISSTTCSAAPLSLPVPSTAPPRSLTTTSAPRWARSSACSRPRPPPAPVMMTTLPSNPRSAMTMFPPNDDRRGHDAARAPPRRYRSETCGTQGRSPGSGEAELVERLGAQGAVVELAVGRAAERRGGQDPLGRLVRGERPTDVSDQGGLVDRVAGVR